MQTRVALLRGINVGGHHKVIMKELVLLMEQAGYSHVKTYIQSGNIIYQVQNTPKARIGDLIKMRWGFSPQVMEFGVNEFLEIARLNPFQSDQGKKIHLFFLDGPPHSINESLLEKLKADSETYQLIGNVFYLYAPEGIGRSKLAAKIGRVFDGVSLTARNLNTVNKLVSMLEDLD